MSEKNIDEQLRVLEQMQDKNWQRISFNLRKHLDAWSHDHVKPAWGHMKLSYWPVICNISVDGSTAAEISRKSMITKQNISRTLKELEEHGMIYSQINKNDKRSEVILLTEAGKKLILEANGEALGINEVYKKLVGEKELATTLEVLKKINAYHESLAENENDHPGE
jgi:DNA-binding MarR family transcriptional regulator